jgi:hypothetical protein
MYQVRGLIHLVDQAPDGFLEIVWEKSERRSWSGSPRG